VEKIIDHRVIDPGRRRKKYVEVLVKWIGWTDPTWEKF